MLGAFCTAFYMTRLIAMTFYGEYRGAGHDPHGLTVPSETHGHDDHGHGDDHAQGQEDHGVAHALAHDAQAQGAHGHAAPASHGHGPTEVSWRMWLPVSILAGLAVVLGFLNYPESLHRIIPIVPAELFSKWIEPLLYQVAPAHHGEHVPPFIEYGLMAWATLVWAPGAMLLAWWIYKVDPSWSRAKAFVARFPNLFRWVNAKYYVDEFYDAAIIEPIKRFSAQLWSFDTWVVDGMVNGAARATLIWAELMNWVDEYLVDGAVDLVEYFVQQTSGVFRGLQSGRVQNYAFVMFIGFLVFAFWKFLV
jgi:NADH-quinone oxidoreductase subunit L